MGIWDEVKDQMYADAHGVSMEKAASERQHKEHMRQLDVAQREQAREAKQAARAQEARDKELLRQQARQANAAEKMLRRQLLLEIEKKFEAKREELTRRKCPRCAELIKREATICRYCSAELSDVDEQVLLMRAAVVAFERGDDVVFTAATDGPAKSVEMYLDELDYSARPVPALEFLEWLDAGEYPEVIDDEVAYRPMRANWFEAIAAAFKRRAFRDRADATTWLTQQLSAFDDPSAIRSHINPNQILDETREEVEAAGATISEMGVLALYRDKPVPGRKRRGFLSSLFGDRRAPTGDLLDDLLAVGNMKDPFPDHAALERASQAGHQVHFEQGAKVGKFLPRVSAPDDFGAPSLALIRGNAEDRPAVRLFVTRELGENEIDEIASAVAEGFASSFPTEGPYSVPGMANALRERGHLLAVEVLRDARTEYLRLEEAGRRSAVSVINFCLVLVFLVVVALLFVKIFFLKPVT